MAQGSGNVSNILGLGSLGAGLPAVVIPEPNTQGYFTLSGGGAVGNNNFGVFYKNGVAYQVTAGKTCKVVSIIASANLATDFIQLVSATASFAQGASSLTGPVYQYGGSSAASGFGGMITNSTGATFTSWSVLYDFAASTFPGWQNVASGTATFWIHLICKEV